MEYSSFYGGRRGASFAIVKNFTTIQEMAQAFRDASYSLVKFDEYVLIDTTDKSHPDNGKIFKRGYGYNSGKTIRCYNSTTKTYQNIDAGGAQYIGNIGATSATAISKTEVLVQSGDQLTINKWYGTGIVKGGILYCTIPLNKVLSSTLSKANITNGMIQIYYNGQAVASSTITSLTVSSGLSAVGINLQLNEITYQTTPPTNSIVGLEISNLTFTITNS